MPRRPGLRNWFALYVFGNGVSKDLSATFAWAKRTVMGRSQDISQKIGCRDRTDAVCVPEARVRRAPWLLARILLQRSRNTSSHATAIWEGTCQAVLEEDAFESRVYFSDREVENLGGLQEVDIRTASTSPSPRLI